MSLRRNATEFEERVRAAPISGNIDNPEGGFDALMQVTQNCLKKENLYKSFEGDCLWGSYWLEGRCQEGDHLHN